MGDTGQLTLRWRSGEWTMLLSGSMCFRPLGQRRRVRVASRRLQETLWRKLPRNSSYIIFHWPKSSKKFLKKCQKNRPKFFPKSFKNLFGWLQKDFWRHYDVKVAKKSQNMVGLWCLECQKKLIPTIDSLFHIYLGIWKYARNWIPTIYSRDDQIRALKSADIWAGFAVLSSW